jgi:hypothetical protein
MAPVRGSGIAFGQQAGPPASHKQLQYLESLVRAAGYDGFRDARHPLDLSQRQAGGRFTRDEASTLIDLLLAGDADQEAPSAPPRRASRRPQPALSDLPSEAMAEELRRRGWTVTER